MNIQHLQLASRVTCCACVGALALGILVNANKAQRDVDKNGVIEQKNNYAVSLYERCTVPVDVVNEGAPITQTIRDKTGKVVKVQPFKAEAVICDGNRRVALTAKTPSGTHVGKVWVVPVGTYNDHFPEPKKGR